MINLKLTDKCPLCNNIFSESTYRQIFISYCGNCYKQYDDFIVRHSESQYIKDELCYLEIGIHFLKSEFFCTYKLDFLINSLYFRSRKFTPIPDFNSVPDLVSIVNALILFS